MRRHKCNFNQNGTIGLQKRNWRSWVTMWHAVQQRTDNSDRAEQSVFRLGSVYQGMKKCKCSCVKWNWTLSVLNFWCIGTWKIGEFSISKKCNLDVTYKLQVLTKSASKRKVCSYICISQLTVPDIEPDRNEALRFHYYNLAVNMELMYQNFRTHI